MQNSICHLHNRVKAPEKLLLPFELSPSSAGTEQTATGDLNTATGGQKHKLYLDDPTVGGFFRNKKIKVKQQTNPKFC